MFQSTLLIFTAITAAVSYNLGRITTFSKATLALAGTREQCTCPLLFSRCRYMHCPKSERFASEKWWNSRWWIVPKSLSFKHLRSLRLEREPNSTSHCSHFDCISDDMGSFQSVFFLQSCFPSNIKGAILPCGSYTDATVERTPLWVSSHSGRQRQKLSAENLFNEKLVKVWIYVL